MGVRPGARATRTRPSAISATAMAASARNGPPVTGSEPELELVVAVVATGRAVVGVVADGTTVVVAT